MGKGIGLGLLFVIGAAVVLLVPELRNKVLPKGFSSSLTPALNQSINNFSPSQNLNKSENIINSLSELFRQNLNFGGSGAISTQQEHRFIPGPTRLTRDQLLSFFNVSLRPDRIDANERIL